MFDYWRTMMDKTIQRCHEALAMLAQDGDMSHWTAAHTVALRDAVTVLAAERKDAERYRWLRERLISVDWDYMGTGGAVLLFTVPAELTISADCDATVDSAMLAEPAVGAA